MKALVVALLALSCARHAPVYSPIVVYRTAYLPAVTEPPIVSNGYFGGPSVSMIPVRPPPPDPDHASEVYGYGYGYPAYGSASGVVYAPTARAGVVVVKDLPPSQRKHTRWHYDRAVKRCDERGTKWARERCYRGAAR